MNHAILFVKKQKQNDGTICCKRFSVLRQTIFNLLRTIFGRTDIRLTGFTMLKPDKGKTRMFSGFTSLLSHLPQTVFRPKRFASFRPPLYQRFKVNFLPSYPSPKFHRKTGRPHETVFNKIAFRNWFSTHYGEGSDTGAFILHLRGQIIDSKHTGLPRNVT